MAHIIHSDSQDQLHGRRFTKCMIRSPIMKIASIKLEIVLIRAINGLYGT